VNMGLALLAILVAAMLLYAVVVSGAGKKRRPRHPQHRSHTPTTGQVSRLDPAETRGRWDTIAVWRAHKLRNTLAHELNFDLVPSQAHEALADFERGLRELGAL
jgi:hypothetical protein